MKSGTAQAFVSQSKFTRSLQKLQEHFNPALCYAFQPENSSDNPKAHAHFNLLLGLVGQYQDLANAYLYAQKTILPFLEKEGLEKLTPELIQTWLKELHKRIAKNLGKLAKTAAGLYRATDVFRWHSGNELVPYINSYLMGHFPNREPVIEVALKGGGIRAEINDFLDLLDSFKNREDIVLEPTQLKTIHLLSENPALRQANYTQNRLAIAYHRGLLSKKDRDTFNKIIALSPPPDELEERMKTFCQSLIENWKKCDPKKDQDIVDLAFYSFYNITEIHPHWNGNGRLATCFMNVILKSFHKRSILLRYPGEKSNPQSLYSRAIKDINTKPELLKQHIAERLEEKEEYQNPDQQKYAVYRSAMCETAELIAKKVDPDLIISSINKSTNEQAAQVESESGITLTQQNMGNYPKQMADIAQGVFEKLYELYGDTYLELLKAEQVAKPSAEIASKTYSKKDIEDITSALQGLTGQTRILSFNKKSGLSVLMYIDKCENTEKCISLLNKTGAMKVSKKQDPATKLDVLLLENIRPEKLKTVKPEKQVSTHSLEK